jgi:hypothetical protein
MWKVISGALVALILTLPQLNRAEVVADFEHRVDQYVGLHRLVEAVLPPVLPSSSRAEVMRATARQHDTVRRGRENAREGDVFTPPIAEYFRSVVADTCHGDFTVLLRVTEDEFEPLGTARINERWPGALLTMMPPKMLAAFPPLPPEVEYRFVHHDLVLWDVHVDLIVDVLRDAIPAEAGLPENRR